MGRASPFTSIGRRTALNAWSVAMGDLSRRHGEGNDAIDGRDGRHDILPSPTVTDSGLEPLNGLVSEICEQRDGERSSTVRTSSGESLSSSVNVTTSPTSMVVIGHFP